MNCSTERIISSLKNCKKTGSNKWQACCPAHDDRKASLSITDSDNKTLIYCHAGCSVDRILNKLGMTERDLFNNIDNQKPKVEAEYNYTDENGKNLYRVIRLYPKSFYQQKYDNGEWNNTMQNVDYVLYNLPNVIKSDIVYFVEGEKDANNLNKAGLVATTTVGGANGYNKHKKEYVKHLNNKTVYIIPDNDEAGKKYALSIKQSLKGIAKDTKILDLKEIFPDIQNKEDISDVLEKHGEEVTLKELEKLTEKKSFPIESKNEINEESFNKLLEYLNIKLYYDVISKKYKVKGLPGKYAEAEHLNILPVFLMNILRNKGIIVQKALIEDYIALNFAAHNVNPIKEMFESIEWDGIDRIEKIYEILHLDNPLYKVLVKKWLYQTALLVYNDFDKSLNNEGILTFQGEERIGKSSFFKELAMKSEWFGDGLSIDVRDKDSIMRATNRWITEIGEADETINKMQPALKSFISSSVDDIRAPYGRNSIMRPRTTSFCATVNPQDFLKTPTGNRRFWVIPVKKIEHQELRNLGNEWIKQLWIQVYEEAKKDISCYRLNEDEYKKLTENNLLFTEFLPYEEELYELLENKEDTKKYWTNSELISTYFPSANAQQLGKVLNKIKNNYPELVSIKRTSTGYKYYMSLKNKNKNVQNVYGF